MLFCQQTYKTQNTTWSQLNHPSLPMYVTVMLDVYQVYHGVGCHVKNESCSSSGLEWKSMHTFTPQPFYGPFSATTRVSRCQKRTSGLYGARED